MLAGDEAQRLRSFITTFAERLSALAGEARQVLDDLAGPQPDLEPEGDPHSALSFEGRDGSGEQLPVMRSRRIEWDPTGLVGYRIIDDRQAAGLACIDCGLDHQPMVVVGRCDGVQVVAHRAHREGPPRLVSRLGDRREHDVLCSSCFTRRTWNLSGICDACSDRTA